MPLPSFLRETQGAVSLSVRVQPRASRNEIVGPMGDALKVKVTAPPVDSAANAALVAFLAAALAIPPRQVELVRGQTSRQKLLRVTGLGANEVARRLAPGP